LRSRQRFDQRLDRRQVEIGQHELALRRAARDGLAKQLDVRRADAYADEQPDDGERRGCRGQVPGAKLVLHRGREQRAACQRLGDARHDQIHEAARACLVLYRRPEQLAGDSSERVS
jgi:hypothetical protein